MSVYTDKIKVEKCNVILKPESVVITYIDSFGIDGGYKGIEISTPEEAHKLREVVNKAVDIILRNDLKK